MKLLLAAKNPVITTSTIGRDPDGMPALAELAELLGAPVIESNSAVVSNLPKEIIVIPSGVEGQRPGRRLQGRAIVVVPRLRSG